MLTLPLPLIRRSGSRLRSSRLLPFGLGILTVLAAGLTSGKAQGAERIEFIYDPVGSLPIVVTVKDLRQYAETGKASGAVQLYTKLAPKSQEDILKSVLLQSYRISPTTIEQFTSTQLGNQMLQQVSQVIRLSPNGKKQDAIRAKALKSALVQAAKNPQGFTLLSFLEGFPNSTLGIDVKQSIVIIRELFRLFQQHESVVSALRSESQATPTPAATPQPRLSQPDPAKLGAYQWQVETLTVQNPARQRSFPVDLYRPILKADPAPSVPLVVISHGLASNRSTFGYLARHLASQGFAVAVVEHPGTSTQQIQRFFAGLDSLGGTQDWLNRPRDITALLDTLTKMAKTEPARKTKINLEAVGIIGQSLGGYTSLALAGAELNLKNLRQDCPQEGSKTITLNIALLFQCEANTLPGDRYQLQDPRIKAAIAVNSIGSSIFGVSGMQAVKTPVLMVSGADDVIAPTIAEQVVPFSWLTTPHKYLVLVDQGTHFSFLEGSQADQVVRVPAELVGPNPALAQPLLQFLSTAFFNRYLRQDQQAETYLSPTYLKTAFQPPFTASIFQSLSEQGVSWK